MKLVYPTLERVNTASNYDLCKWWRFLCSPGISVAGQIGKEHDEVFDREVQVMDRIAERMKEPGNGFTPEISKHLGWDNPPYDFLREPI